MRIKCLDGLKKILTNKKHNLLKMLPHQRVVDKNVYADEVFDLYRLGVFLAPDSFLAKLSGDKSSSDAVNEIVELVELQPSAEYRPHYHKKSAAVIYIVLGDGTFQLDKMKMAYQPGSRIVIPAGILHGFSTNTRTLFLSIQSPPILDAERNTVDLFYEEDSYDKK